MSQGRVLSIYEKIFSIHPSEAQLNLDLFPQSRLQLGNLLARSRSCFGDVLLGHAATADTRQLNYGLSSGRATRCSAPRMPVRRGYQPSSGCLENIQERRDCSTAQDPHPQMHFNSKFPISRALQLCGQQSLYHTGGCWGASTFLTSVFLHHVASLC